MSVFDEAARLRRDYGENVADAYLEGVAARLFEELGLASVSDGRGIRDGETVKYRVGSMCHCGFPEDCDAHWQVQTDEEPAGGPIQHVIADDLDRENAEKIAHALNVSDAVSVRVRGET